MEEREREGMCKKHGLYGGDISTALCSANNRVKCKTSELTANKTNLMAQKYTKVYCRGFAVQFMDHVKDQQC